MPELSDADVRAILVALIRRHHGMVEIGNAELYDAMLPSGGAAHFPFAVEETPTGIRVSLRDNPVEDWENDRP